MRASLTLESNVRTYQTVETNEEKRVYVLLRLYMYLFVLEACITTADAHHF